MPPMRMRVLLRVLRLPLMVSRLLSAAVAVSQRVARCALRFPLRLHALPLSFNVRGGDWAPLWTLTLVRPVRHAPAAGQGPREGTSLRVCSLNGEARAS